MTVLTSRPRVFGRVESWADASRRIALVLLLGLGAGSIVTAAWSLARGGIGWDALFDTNAALTSRSIDSSSSLGDAYDVVPETSEFYGVFLQQFADVLHLLTTGSTTPLAADKAETYLYQGAATLLLSVTAVTALAIAIASAFRSILAGAFAWSLTLATPLWLGMSHVDFKDMPVAAGITLVTAGLMLSFVTASPRKATLLGVLLAGCGGAIAVATRPAALVLLGALVAGTLVTVLLWAFARGRARAALPVVITSVSVPVLGLAFTWATNPLARLGTFGWLQDAIEVAQNYPWDSWLRAGGTDVRSTELPWWYVPGWLVAQLPLLTIAAVVGGMGALAVIVIRPRRSISATTTIPLVPIVLQAVVLPVGIVISGAVLYDGIRHLLFIVPALIAIPAVALAVLDRRPNGAGRRLRIVLPLAAVVIVAASLAASIRWAPYAYAHINPIAGHDKGVRAWELDFWGVSGREGVRRLREAGLSRTYVEPTSGVAFPWGGISLPIEPGDHVGLYVFLRGPRAGPNRPERAAEFGCKVIFTVRRGGLVLGEGARCPGAA